MSWDNSPPRAGIGGFARSRAVRSMVPLHRIGTKRTMKTYMCVVCGFVYDEAKGLPQEGIKAGTLWDDIPENWKCPECGAAKSDFEMIEI